MCKWAAGCPPPTPSAFFKDRNVFSDEKANSPLSEATKTCTQGLLPHQKKKPHENDFRGLRSEENVVSHTSNLPACKTCGAAAMGVGCPLQPLLFFKNKLPAHKKPILNRTSSPTNLSAAVPEAFTQERDCHPHENASGAFTEWVLSELKQSEVLDSRQLQLEPQVGVGVRVNPNPNLRFWVGVPPNSNLRLEFWLTPTLSLGWGWTSQPGTCNLRFQVRVPTSYNYLSK